MLVNNILYSPVHGIYQFPDAECCSGEIRGQLIFFFAWNTSRRIRIIATILSFHCSYSRAFILSGFFFSF